MKIAHLGPGTDWPCPVIYKHKSHFLPKISSSSVCLTSSFYTRCHPPGSPLNSLATMLFWLVTALKLMISLRPSLPFHKVTISLH